MSQMSRRAAMGTMTATVIGGLATKVVAGAPTAPTAPTSPATPMPDGPVKPMSLDEFTQMNSPEEAENLFRHVEGHTFSMCHKKMAEEQGIWIPELVPVFEKLDQMRAAHS